MKISDPKVRIVKKEGGRLKAVASVIIEDCFVVHDIKIVESPDGSVIIAMPSRRTPDGEYKDVAHPLNPETRKMFSDLVMAEYERVLKEGI